MALGGGRKRPQTGRPKRGRTRRRERPRGERRAAAGRRRGVAEVRAAARSLAGLLGGALRKIGSGAVAAAEWIGRQEVKLGRLGSGPVLALARVSRGAIRTGARAVTPRRAVGTVVLCAAVLLGVSQFVDYRGVGIGIPLYEGVEAAAPPPQTERETAGSAHAYVLLPVAVLAIGALVFALRGRWQLGRVVSALGVVGVAVTLLIDRPQGLDEGPAGLAFESADAILIEGFWVQLSASVVLVFAGLLLSRYVRAEHPAGRGWPSRRRAARGRGGPAAPAAGMRA